MKVLFITHSYPNYAPDLLLHGLRKLMGDAVVDYPKKDCLYQGVLGSGVCPDNQLCPTWFPPDNGQIDRTDIQAKLRSGFFDLIVCDVRSAPLMRELANGLRQPLVVIDGEDRPLAIPPGNFIICRRETDGTDFSIPLPMGLPKEILDWIASYDHLPKKYSIGFLGSTDDDSRRRVAETISRYYPDSLLQATAIPSEENQLPEGRFGRDEYYRSLQQCRMVLSLAGAGYDTFRFWENAACNAVHIAARMPLLLPHDFVDEAHILRFNDIDQLRCRIDLCLSRPQAFADMIRDGRHHLIQYHLTTSRAAYFIDRIHQAYHGLSTKPLSKGSVSDDIVYSHAHH
jgi:hypothetical protein